MYTNNCLCHHHAWSWNVDRKRVSRICKIFIPFPNKFEYFFLFVVYPFHLHPIHPSRFYIYCLAHFLPLTSLVTAFIIGHVMGTSALSIFIAPHTQTLFIAGRFHAFSLSSYYGFFFHFVMKCHKMNRKCIRTLRYGLWGGKYILTVWTVIATDVWYSRCTRVNRRDFQFVVPHTMLRDVIECTSGTLTVSSAMANIQTLSSWFVWLSSFV